jgi:hypothetical protein
MDTGGEIGTVRARHFLAEWLQRTKHARRITHFFVIKNEKPTMPHARTTQARHRTPIGASCIIPPSLSELQSFIVEIYKQVGTDSSKSIVATASTTTGASSKTIIRQNRTTLASADRRTTTRAVDTTRPAPNNYAKSTTPVEVDFSIVEQASKLNKEVFNFNKHGAQRSLLAFKKQNLEQHRVVLFACCSICEMSPFGLFFITRIGLMINSTLELPTTEVSRFPVHSGGGPSPPPPMHSNN